MKKTAIFTLIIMSVVLLAGCTGREEPFTRKSFETKGAEIREVNIDVRDRQIEVSPSEDEQIHIDYFENSKEYYDITVSEDKVLTMTAADNKEWTDYIDRKADKDSRRISLQIPDSLLSSLTLGTTNEDILLSALTVTGDIFLSVNGGNITFDKLNVGNALHLEGKNGNIKGSIIGSYDDFTIACDIKKGNSNLPSKKHGSKHLNASNNNGDIDIEFVKE